ncbi:MAG: tetratricopeptide repeat protein [Candidatus Methanomethylophilaceae archaeon]|nr:tetratricopeptide repeat protein [Candidatus Methanomethylophilaceae archaeon]
MLDNISNLKHPDPYICEMFDRAIVLLDEDKDSKDAVDILKKVSEQGCSEAMVVLGNIYIEGTSEEKEYALDQYRKAADLGDSSGMRNLGYCYSLGKGCVQNKEKAAEWYRRSAEAGNSRAQTNLGVLYEYGHGVPQSDAEAFKWYLMSANNGYSRGQTNVGVLLLEGRGVEKDLSEAKRWFEEAGTPRSKYNLGNMYLHGIGIPTDKNMAIKLFTESSDAGYSKSMVQLALLSENKDAMIILLKKAASKRNKEAIKMLNMFGIDTQEYVVKGCSS